MKFTITKKNIDQAAKLLSDHPNVASAIRLEARFRRWKNNWEVTIIKSATSATQIYIDNDLTNKLLEFASPEEQKGVKIIMRRHEIAVAYCKEKGWPESSDELEMVQILEIRSQQNWIDVPTLVIEGK